MAAPVLEIKIAVVHPHSMPADGWVVQSSWKVIDGRSRARIDDGKEHREMTDASIDKEAVVADHCGEVAQENGVTEAELTVEHLRSSYPTDAAANRGMARIQGLISERNPNLTVYMGWGRG